MRNRILPQFEDFLLSRSLVPAKNAPFYAHRVSKFLAFSQTSLIVFTQRNRFNHDTSSPVKAGIEPAWIFFLDIFI
jgi:hypothetical protein